MADSTISNLNSVSLPLDGTEVLPIVQGSETKKVTKENLLLGKSVTDTSVSTSYNIDWSSASNWELVILNNTTITESNTPPLGTEKTITIYISGVFALTLPASWSATGNYDGANGTQIVIQSWNNGSYNAVLNPL